VDCSTTTTVASGVTVLDSCGIVQAVQAAGVDAATHLDAVVFGLALMILLLAFTLAVQVVR
jgi:hypothetical protein